MLTNMNAQEFAIPYFEQQSYWSSTIFIVVAIGMVIGFVGVMLALRRWSEVVLLAFIAIFVAFVATFVASGAIHSLNKD